MATKLPYPLSSSSPIGEPVRDIPVANLWLDTENPRLQVKDTASQDTVLKLLIEDHRLEELLNSLVENGYFTEEPLVAVPHKTKKEHFVVVEGNRRLAALKLLLDPGMIQRLAPVQIPDATQAQLERLYRVPVKVYPKRSDVLPYLGFRHITGIKEWDAASKARYVFQLKHGSSIELHDIAHMIGDTYNMTERLYLGWSLIVQAEEDLGVSKSEFYKFPFSYMYDAVRMPEIKEFLGLTREGKFRVSSAHHGQLKELLDWLFGSQVHHRRPIVEKKTQLKQLASAVADKNGLSALRRGLSLDEAYKSTIGEMEQLLTWLTRAGRDLDNAKGVVHRHREADEVQELVEKCADTAARMAREIRI